MEKQKWERKRLEGGSKKKQKGADNEFRQQELGHLNYK